MHQYNMATNKLNTHDYGIFMLFILKLNFPLSTFHKLQTHHDHKIYKTLCNKFPYSLVPGGTWKNFYTMLGQISR